MRSARASLLLMKALSLKAVRMRRRLLLAHDVVSPMLAAEVASACHLTACRRGATILDRISRKGIVLCPQGAPAATRVPCRPQRVQQLRLFPRSARRSGEREQDAPGARAAASLPGLAADHLRRHAAADGDEPGGAVAPEDRHRQRRRQPQGAGMAGGPAHLRAPGRQAGAGGHCRHRDGADRRGGRGGGLHRELLHRERGPVGGVRPAQPPVRPPPAPVARLLRQPPARHHPVHRHRRRQDDPGVRVVGNAGHPGGPAHHRRHAGHHVLAQLGLRPHRGRGHAVPAAVRRAHQPGREEGDPRGAQAPERRHGGGAAGPGIGARRAGVRRAGHRGGAPQGGQPCDGGCGARGAAREVAALARRLHRRGLVHGVRAVSRHRADHVGRHDGRRADRVPRLPEQVLQAGPGSRQDEQHHRPDGGGDRAHPDHPGYRHDRPRASRRARARRAQGRDRVRARGLRLRSEGAGAQGRELAHRARPAGRAWSARPAAESPPS